MNTKQGISDLQRFWHGAPWDFDLDRLEAFYDCLPTESSTFQALAKLSVDFGSYLNAMVIDSIRALHIGMAGKKMKKDQRIASIFTEDEKKDEKGRSPAVRAAKKAEERRRLAEKEDETLELKPHTTAEDEKK